MSVTIISFVNSQTWSTINLRESKGNNPIIFKPPFLSRSSSKCFEHLYLWTNTVMESKTANYLWTSIVHSVREFPAQNLQNREVIPSKSIFLLLKITFIQENTYITYSNLLISCSPLKTIILCKQFHLTQCSITYNSIYKARSINYSMYNIISKFFWIWQNKMTIIYVILTLN